MNDTINNSLPQGFSISFNYCPCGKMVGSSAEGVPNKFCKWCMNAWVQEQMLKEQDAK